MTSIDWIGSVTPIVHAVMKNPIRAVVLPTTNLLSLLFLTNTDTTWSFCGCDNRRGIYRYTEYTVLI